MKAAWILFILKGKPMKLYEVIAPTGASVTGGTLKLAKPQAALRAHALKELGNGLYEVVTPVQFKRGEQFGWAGEGNKLLLQDITPAEAPAKAEKATKTAQSAAAASDADAALDGLKVADLRALAAEKGLEIAAKATKAEIIAAIKAAEGGAAPEDAEDSGDDAETGAPEDAQTSDAEEETPSINR